MAAQHKRPGRTAKRERQRRARERARYKLRLELFPVEQGPRRPGRAVAVAWWEEGIAKGRRRKRSKAV